MSYEYEDAVSFAFNKEDGDGGNVTEDEDGDEPLYGEEEEDDLKDSELDEE